MVACGVCGEENPARARFCLGCGTPLAAAAEPETRKVVTVVFSDLAGSTSLGGRLDPESLGRVMARWFEAMRAVLERHGGTVQTAPVAAFRLLSVTPGAAGHARRLDAPMVGRERHLRLLRDVFEATTGDGAATWSRCSAPPGSASPGWPPSSWPRRSARATAG
jgi:class 3 adenylate cyclase